MSTISSITAWLPHVSEAGFIACYILVLLLELSRLFFQIAVRHALILLLTAAGLFAHVVWFCLSARTPINTPLTSWYGWCMLIALALAFVYLMVRIRNPKKSVGLFLLPLILALVGAAVFFLQDKEPFVTDSILSFWSILHAMALLIGSITASLGFAAGIMYLVQAFRLKRKLPPRQGLQLPSLERLQRYNYMLLTTSTALLATGVLAGLIRKASLLATMEKSSSWDPMVVVSSGILLLWLITIALFEYFYKPARQGKKVAYLTVTSFVILSAVMGLMFATEHALELKEQDSSARTTNSRLLVPTPVGQQQYRGAHHDVLEVTV